MKKNENNANKDNNGLSCLTGNSFLFLFRLKHVCTVKINCEVRQHISEIFIYSIDLIN